MKEPKGVSAERPRKKPCRDYELYSRDRYALDLKNRYVEHLHGLNCWIFTVCARSIQQAYALAHQHVWADGPGQVGIRRIESAHWRWREDMTSDEARAAGLIQEAPYLRRPIAKPHTPR